MILITFALEEEAAPFRRRAKSMPGIEILVTGVGKRNAEEAVHRVLDSITPTCVLTCGYAGALSPELQIADLVYDVDAPSALELPFKSLDAVRVKFHCAEKVLVTANQKIAARLQTGAQAVDMESEYIRRICHKKSIPSATLRAISDLADEDMPLDFNALAKPDQSLCMGKLALAILSRPGCLPGLMRLRKHTKQAAETLAEGLMRLIQSLTAFTL